MALLYRISAKPYLAVVDVGSKKMSLRYVAKLVILSSLTAESGIKNISAPLTQTGHSFLVIDRVALYQKRLAILSS